MCFSCRKTLNTSHFGSKVMSLQPFYQGFCSMHSFQIQFFDFFLFWIRTSPMLRIFISSLNPFMIIKIVSHLANRFSSWCLVFDRDLSQPCAYIKLDMVSFENILIFLINFDVFIPFDSQVICALKRSFVDIFQFILNPVDSFLLVQNEMLFTIILRSWLSWRRWRRFRFGCNLDIVLGKVALNIWILQSISKPPSAFISLDYQNFIAFIKFQISDFLILLFLFLISVLCRLLFVLIIQRRLIHILEIVFFQYLVPLLRQFTFFLSYFLIHLLFLFVVLNFWLLFQYQR